LNALDKGEEMIDWDTLIVYVLGAIFGVILTFLLTGFSDWKKRRSNTDSLRRLSYSDILRIFSKLYWLRDYISTDLAARKLNFEDDALANTWLEHYQSYLKEILDDDWYKRARADPNVFLRFAKDEQTAINAIYELLSLTVAGRIYDASIEVFHKIAAPRKRIISQRDGVSNLIDELENYIRTGLREEVLLSVATRRDKWYIAWIFHRREIEEIFSEAERQGILSSAERHAHPDFLVNIGEQFAQTSFNKKQKRVLSQCWNCKHYDNGTCAAFPGGIPEDMLSNHFLHTKEYSGDRGIRYDPIDTTSINFREKEATEKKKKKASLLKH
jgi:hypothetical protein